MMCSTYYKSEISKKLFLVKGKKYKEILGIIKEAEGGAFYISGEKYFSNNISYIAKGLEIFCDTWGALQSVRLKT